MWGFEQVLRFVIVVYWAVLPIEQPEWTAVSTGLLAYHPPFIPLVFQGFTRLSYQQTNKQNKNQSIVDEDPRGLQQLSSPTALQSAALK